MAAPDARVPHTRLVKASLSPYLLKFRGRRLLRRLLRDPKVSVLDFCLSPGSSSPFESVPKAGDGPFVPGHASVTVCVHGEPRRVPVVTLVLDEVGADGDPLPRPSPEEMDSWLSQLRSGQVTPLRHLLVVSHRPLEKSVRRATETEAWFRPYALKTTFLRLPGSLPGEASQGFMAVDSDGWARLWGFGFDASTLAAGAKRRPDRWKLLCRFRFSTSVNDVAELRAFTSEPGDTVSFLWLKALRRKSDKSRRRRRSMMTTADIIGSSEAGLAGQMFTTQIGLGESSPGSRPERRKRSSSWDLQSPGEAVADFASDVEEAGIHGLLDESDSALDLSPSEEAAGEGNLDDEKREDREVASAANRGSLRPAASASSSTREDQRRTPPKRGEAGGDTSFPPAVRSPQLFGSPSIDSVASGGSTVRDPSARSLAVDLSEMSPDGANSSLSPVLPPRGPANGDHGGNETRLQTHRLVRESSLPIKEPHEDQPESESPSAAWEAIRACLSLADPKQMNLDSLRLVLDPPYLGPVDNDMLLFRQTLMKQGRDFDPYDDGNQRIRFGNASSLSSIPAGSIASMIEDGAWLLVASTQKEHGREDRRNLLCWVRASYVSLQRRRTVHVHLDKSEIPSGKPGAFYPCVFVSRGGLAIAVWESGRMLILLHERGDSEVRKWVTQAPPSAFRDALRPKHRKQVGRKLQALLLDHTVDYTVWDESEKRTREGHMLCCALAIACDNGTLAPLYVHLDCSHKCSEEIALVPGDLVLPEDNGDGRRLHSLVGRLVQSFHPSSGSVAPCAVDLHLVRLPKPTVDGTEDIGDALSQVRTVNEGTAATVQQLSPNDALALQAMQLQKVLQLDRPGQSLDVLQLLGDESSAFFPNLVNALYEKRTSAVIPFLEDVTELRCRVATSTDRQAIREGLFAKALEHLPKWDSSLVFQASARPLAKLQTSVLARLLLEAGRFCQCGALLAATGDHRSASALGRAWAGQLRACKLRRPYAGKLMLFATFQEDCLLEDLEQLMDKESRGSAEILSWWRCLSTEMIAKSSSADRAFEVHALACTIWSRLLGPSAQKEADGMGARGRSFLHRLRIRPELKTRILEELGLGGAEAKITDGEFQALCAVDRRADWFNKCGIDNGVLVEASGEQRSRPSEVPSASDLCSLAYILDAVVREPLENGSGGRCLTTCGERSWWED
eukprot:scaffold904_cov239-Pinguiococcus_pyrenoidosus.AAC.2